MIRIVLVLSLLKLAISSKIPIQKQIVGPGGENINVNIEVDIDLPDDDTTGGVTQGPPTPRTTDAPEKCLTPGEICIPGDECCGGLSCVQTDPLAQIHKCKHIHKPPTCLKDGNNCSPSIPQLPCCDGLSCMKSEEYVFPPIHKCRHIHHKPRCLVAGETCSTSRLGRPECCGGLSCVDSGKKIDPPKYWCWNAAKPTEPTCLKTGEACAPSAGKKCCPNNLCDLDNLKCVRVQERRA